MNENVPAGTYTTADNALHPPSKCEYGHLAKTGQGLMNTINIKQVQSPQKALGSLCIEENYKQDLIGV